MAEKYTVDDIISMMSKCSDALGYNGLSDTLNMDSEERKRIFGYFFENLKKELFKQPELKDIALLFNSDLERIKREREKENQKYLGGMFNMSMDSESTFVMSFEMFFQLPDGKHNKVSAQSESISIEELYPSAREELVAQGQVGFEIE